MLWAIADETVWNRESLFRGWQLMCVLLVTFPPSKNFEAYLRAFVQQNTTQTEGRVDVMAKYCLQRLAIISKKGPRGKAPSMAEIETASVRYFILRLDGTFANPRIRMPPSILRRLASR